MSAAGRAVRAVASLTLVTVLVVLPVSPAAAEQGCPGGGADSGGLTAPSPRLDTEMADVETAAAEPDEAGTGSFAASGKGMAAVGASACPAGNVGNVGGVVIPTRIDAGAGATAVGGNPAAAVAAGSASALMAAVLEGVRRRRRS